MPSYMSSYQIPKESIAPFSRDGRQPISNTYIENAVMVILQSLTTIEDLCFMFAFYNGKFDSSRFDNNEEKRKSNASNEVFQFY